MMCYLSAGNVISPAVSVLDSLAPADLSSHLWLQWAASLWSEVSGVKRSVTDRPQPERSVMTHWPLYVGGDELGCYSKSNPSVCVHSVDFDTAGEFFGLDSWLDTAR